MNSSLFYYSSTLIHRSLNTTISIKMSYRFCLKSNLMSFKIDKTINNKEFRMTSLGIFLALFVATCGAHMQNLVAIKNIDAQLGWVSYCKVALMCLPISVVVSVGFAYYYTNGVKAFPYLLLSLVALGSSIIFSFIINQFILHQRSFNQLEFIGVIFIIFGVGLTLYSKS